MKKILFLGSLQPGGSEHQMVIVATLLKKEGYDVSYLCGDKSDFYEKNLNEAGIPVLRISENRLSLLLKLNIPRTTLLMKKILKRGKYDTVISFLGLWNFENCFFANKKSTRHKAITGIRNNRDEVFLWKREKFYNWFERYTYLKVSNSEAAKNKYAIYYPKIANKVMTIYNIVELPEVKSTYRFKKEGKVNIIVPASYREVKNPMRLLEAVSLMSLQERQNLNINWYGNIKAGQVLYEKLVSFINDNQLEDSVVLHDATNDIANCINEADVVGLFSTSEGLPNSVCEGMMLSKPVIMTKVSDYDVLVDHTNGFLCDYDNPQSIKEALVLVGKLSENQLKQMGKCSKTKAERLFSKDTILEQWKQII